MPSPGSAGARRPSLGPILLAFATAACGARSEVIDPRCNPLSIGILGNPGAYDTPSFTGWLTTSGADVERLQTTPDEPLTADTLAPFTVVILDRLPRDYTPGEAAVLATWVAGGGGLVSLTGYDNVPDHDFRPNSLLAPLGLAYGGSLRNGPVTDLAPHPITAGLTSIVFEGGYVITDLGAVVGNRTPIAFLPAEDGNGDAPVGYAVETGRGRAFVWGDEWIAFPSKGPQFPPRLWVQAAAWLAPAHTCALTPPGD